MAETLNRGPYGSLGSLTDGITTSAGALVDAIGPYDGPSFFYQGEGFLDPRYAPASKDSLATGRIPIFQNSAEVILVNAIPSASSATPVDIAAAATVTNGVAMTLVSTQPSATTNGQCAHMPNTPLVPFGASAPVTVFGLDMGFCYGTTTTGGTSQTVTVLDSTIFTIGQWIWIGGGLSASKPLLTQVTAIPSGTTITVSTGAAHAQTRGPICNANLYPGFPAGAVPNGVSPYILAGTARVFNPTEGTTRCVGIAASATATGGAFLVTGYDIYGVAMSESITAVTSSVVYGNKCFKYIAAVTPQFTDTTAGHTYSVGVADQIGMNLRTALWEETLMFVAAAQLTVNTGFVAATSLTSTSTTTTTDVRGSIQVGARNVGGSGATGGPFSGTVRITVRKINTPMSMVLATPNGSNTLFGVAQT